MTRLIVVGMDGSEDAERALRWAVQVAAPAQALVRLVAVGADETTTAALDAASLHILMTWPGTALTTEVRSGDPATELVDASRYATMLVLGSHGRSGRPGTMGSVAIACMRTASCPVVVVPGARRRAPARMATAGGRPMTR